MQPMNMFTVTTFASGFLSIVMAGLTVAQSQTDRSDERVAARTANSGVGNSSIGRLDKNTKGNNLRASQVIGMNIYNQSEKSVGEIQDIVMDADSGKVRYAAVTYGGFLGLGDKMFAVPWEAFRCQADKDDPEDHYLVLNVTEKQLDGAKGFDQDNWPDFADRNFTDQIDKRYGVQRKRDRDVDVDVRRNGVDVDVNRNNREN